MIKRIFLLMSALAIMAFAAGCERGDGDTSGSAQSNGVISDESRDHVSDKVSDVPNVSKDVSADISRDESLDASLDESRDLGDDISAVISDVESGAGDLVSRAEGVVSDVIDGVNK